ncbi:hypothetical protein Hanom_Chr16g01485301 [Helianthus anomalus]
MHFSKKTIKLQLLKIKPNISRPKKKCIKQQKLIHLTLKLKGKTKEPATTSTCRNRFLWPNVR